MDVKTLVSEQNSNEDVNLDNFRAFWNENKLNAHLTKNLVYSNDDYVYDSLLKPEREENLTKDEKKYIDLANRQKDPISDIIKYMSSPLRRVPSYQSEAQLLGYPTTFHITYKRGCETMQQLKLTNVTLEPIFVNLHKLVPQISSLRFLNLSRRPTRIPTGLSFMVDVLTDAREPEELDTTILFLIAFKNKSVRTYQICPINIIFNMKKRERQYLREFR